MTSTGQYDVRPEAVRSTVGNVGGIIMQAASALVDLESLVIAPSAFASIGSAVASANTTLASQQVSGLRTLLSLLQQVNDLVKRSADGYDTADQTVAVSYGGNATPASTGTGLWSNSAAAGQLAACAVSDSATGTGSPQSVSTVLGYLNQAGLTSGNGTSGMPTGNPAEFTRWLDASPDHQAALGVIGTYSGVARGFDDVPGGVHNGDVVVISPGVGANDTNSVIGIAANNGQLYNNGLLQPDFGELASLRVYRPMS